MANVRLKNFIGLRVRRLRKLLTERGLDAFVATDRADVRYLTGFTGDDSALVVTANKKILVTDNRYTGQAKVDCPGLRVHVRSESLENAIATIIGKSRKPAHRSIVAVDSDALSVRRYRSLRRTLGRAVGLRGADGLIGQLRLRKDVSEIAGIRRAVVVAEKAMGWLRDHLEIGMTEQEAAGRVDCRMRRLGSSAAAFDTIAAFGRNAALPHARAGRTKLRSAQPMLFDWGATVDGYKSDLTRCYFTGRIPAYFADAYERVLEAQLAAIETVRPGISLKQVDAAARGVLAGRAGCYGHGTGHGIGLDVHEAPAVHSRGGGVVQEGMVLTIEPGIYVPGRFGIRIEDDVLVTAKGHKILSRLAKDLDSVRL